MKKPIFLFFSLLIVSVLFLAGCNSTDKKEPSLSGIPTGSVTLYKGISCGCCGIYTKYIDDHGLNPEVVDLPDMDTIKNKFNVPENLRSCHTTVIGDYFVEGHIPTEAIQKLLSEKPDIAGIAMPGMPSGSPGMPGAKTGPFIIYSVNNDGSYQEFIRI